MNRYSLYGLLVTVVTSGCGNNSTAAGQQDVNPSVMPAAADFYSVYEPLEKSVKREGHVVFDGDTMAVFTEYTDEVAYSQEIQAPSGGDGIMKHHDMLVHLVSKRSGDTITVTREVLIAKIAESDPDAEKFLMMAPSFDVETQSGNVKMMLDMCLPDSDFCYYYEIRVEGKRLKVKEVYMIETENDPWVTVPQDTTGNTLHPVN